MSSYDCIIIGSGIAGLYVSPLLSRKNKRVLLLTKGGLQDANTSYAQGGIAAAIGPDDSPEEHLCDTLRVGALVADLEFCQFHPTAFYCPPAPCFLISEAVRGEGAVLRDGHGRAFMKDMHPMADLAPRDVVARAIKTRMLEEGSEHLYLDATCLPQGRFEQRFPQIWAFCIEHGVDPSRDWIPVAPAAHYLIGGIWTSLWGETTAPGLFACGEAASRGAIISSGRSRQQIELSNLLLLGRLLVKAALARCESRGVHYRIDCPEPAKKPLRLGFCQDRLFARESAESLRALQ